MARHVAAPARACPPHPPQGKLAKFRVGGTAPGAQGGPLHELCYHHVNGVEGRVCRCVWGANPQQGERWAGEDGGGETRLVAPQKRFPKFLTTSSKF